MTDNNTQKISIVGIYDPENLNSLPVFGEDFSSSVLVLEKKMPDTFSPASFAAVPALGSGWSHKKAGTVMNPLH